MIWIVTSAMSASSFRVSLAVLISDKGRTKEPELPFTSNSETLPSRTFRILPVRRTFIIPSQPATGITILVTEGFAFRESDNALSSKITSFNSSEPDCCKSILKPLISRLVPPARQVCGYNDCENNKEITITKTKQKIFTLYFIMLTSLP